MMRKFANWAAAVMLVTMMPVAALAQSGLSFDSLVGEGAKEIEVTADALEVVQSESLARFEGNVKAVQGTLTLKASHVTMHYRTGDEADDGSPVSLIVADGDVSMASASEKVVCEWMRYDVDAAQITLGGEVELSRDGNTLKGDILVIDLNTGLSRLEGGEETGGRVRGVFVPGKGFTQQ